MENKYRTIDNKLNKLSKIQNQKNGFQKLFYPRVDNRTDIEFSGNELTLLNKGLKYNLNFKPRNWIKNLALEAETALSYLPYTEKEGLRFQMARNLQSLYRHYENNKGHNTRNINLERHTIQSIKNKLQSNKATITKADKGNTIVIIYQKDYCRKIEDFIENNNLVTANNDPTKAFQKKVRNAVNECQIVVRKEERWKYINMNPAAPTIRGMIKIHKADAPI